MNGAAGIDLDEHAVEEAARELIVAAGRPEGYVLIVSAYEREAWRVAARRTIRAYLDALILPPT